jgi:hypothetical protein
LLIHQYNQEKITNKILTAVGLTESVDFSSNTSLGKKPSPNFVCSFFVNGSKGLNNVRVVWRVKLNNKQNISQHKNTFL